MSKRSNDLTITKEFNNATMKQEMIANHAFRLKPGEDLRSSNEKLVQEKV